jgi:cellulose biosynthesis protein BcsQ
MTVVTVGGDHATTTSLALAAGWPDQAGREVLVVEADTDGGSLAAWLDTPLSPSLSSLVTALHQGASSGTTPAAVAATVDSMTRLSPSSIRFVPAPFRATEARGAINEATLSLFPHLAADETVVAIVDIGNVNALRLPSRSLSAALHVIVHRQDASSSPAATVRLERLSETVSAFTDAGERVAVALIGEDPFSLEEVVEFVAPNGPAWTLPIDPLASAVLAGRTGVSGKRLARLPLMRTTASVARDIDEFTRRAAVSKVSS